MKCEICSKDNEKNETLTLCQDCFRKLNENMEFVLIENKMLKIILKDLMTREIK